MSKVHYNYIYICIYILRELKKYIYIFRPASASSVSDRGAPTPSHPHHPTPQPPATPTQTILPNSPPGLGQRFGVDPTLAVAAAAATFGRLGAGPTPTTATSSPADQLVAGDARAKNRATSLEGSESDNSVRSASDPGGSVADGQVAAISSTDPTPETISGLAEAFKPPADPLLTTGGLGSPSLVAGQQQQVHPKGGQGQGGQVQANTQVNQ